jgi:RNA polymerase-binding transcription factor DksA
MVFTNDHWLKSILIEAARRVREGYDADNTRTNLIAAKRRIENNTFTKCMLCGESIPIGEISKDILDTIACSENCRKQLFKNMLLIKHASLFRAGSSNSQSAISGLRDRNHVSLSNHIGETNNYPDTEIKVSDMSFKAGGKAAYLLSRVESGEYRFCKDCGEKIPSARQIAEPISDRCLTCKESAERDDSMNGYGRPQRISKVTPATFV